MSQVTANITDDVIFQINGDKFPCVAGPNLRATGWRGGLWVRYVPPTNNVDEYVVEASDGNEATGFIGFPSENYEPGSFAGPVNNYTGVQLRNGQGAVSGASTVTVTAGGGRMLFLVFETVPLDAGGVRTPGAFITYNLNENLKISENGYLCNDSDARLAMVGIASPLVVGKVCAVPHARNGYRLGMDLKF
jgi:hypothetical protein